jgi:hypothetical protein
MLIDATKKRFWDNHMVGPGTGHERFEYTGDPEKMPKDFIEVTPERLKADEEAKAKELLQKAADSQGVTLQSYMNPGSLPVSGGGAQSTDPKEVAKAIRKGVVPKAAAKGEDGKTIDSAESKPRKAKRAKKDEKRAEANDKMES